MKRYLATLDNKRKGDEHRTYTYDMTLNLSTIDNDSLGFLISQLAFLEPEIYETKYTKIRYTDFVPVVTTDPEWTDNVDYVSWDSVTMGKFLGANAKDLQESDINATKSTIPVFDGGISFAYSLSELRKSQHERIPIDVYKARASFRGFQEHAQSVAFLGDSDRGITGLLNNANVQTDSNAVDWATATSDQIATDMNSLLIKVWTNSKQVHIPNVLVLPPDQWGQIATQTMNELNSMTILEYFKLNNVYRASTGGEIAIKNLLELETAGVASAPRMMAYELNDENLTMRMPLTYRQVAPQADCLRWKIAAEYKFGGVEFRYPGSAAYRDFI